MFFRRPPPSERLAYVRWRPWIRRPALVLCAFAGVGGLGSAVIGLVQVVRSGWSNDATVLVMTGVTIAVMGPAMWAILQAGELVIGRAGLFVGFAFIPWRSVSNIQDDAG